MPTVPDELRYTATHEWVRLEDDGSVRIGITDHAQRALGDVAYVSLPAPGEPTAAGQVCGEVESAASAHALTSPVDGRVAGPNPGLETRPDLVNSDPYGQGWTLRIDPADPAGARERVAALLDAEGYRALTEG